MIKKLLDKVSNPNLKPISGYDAAFLYTESPKSPMHIASLTVVEGLIAFEDFKKEVAAKLHLMPKFRQRLVNVPFNLDYPYWADDPNFDIDLHINHIRLPEPGDWKTLRSLTANLFSAPLDLRRPLWSIHFIEGINGIAQVPENSVAILAKVHHVMVDGASGVGLMGILFSFFPQKYDVNELKPEPFTPEPLPNDLTLLSTSYAEFLKNPLRIPKIAGKTLVNVLKSEAAKKFMFKNEMANVSSSVPRTIFNGHISPKRTWGTAILSLDRVKALKNIMQVTINDLFLATCAGAIRKYLIDRDKLPSQPLVANVPISVRDKNSDSGGEMNNQISNMMIPIATHIADPIERLEFIQEQTIQGKMRHQALGAKTLAEMAEVVPFGVANLAAGVYSRYNLNEWHRPPFNVTITNVPGPQVPLYLNGHKVDSIFGLTPVVDGFGLIIAIFSYNGKISITATSDAKTMPDVEKFARYIREEANELEEIILKKQKEQKAEQEKEERANPYINKIKKYFKANPKWPKKWEGLYQIQVKHRSSEEGWQLDLRNRPAKIGKRLFKNPSALLHIDDKYLTQVSKTPLTWEEALIQGRCKVEGKDKYKELLMEVMQAVG